MSASEIERKSLSYSQNDTIDPRRNSACVFFGAADRSDLGPINGRIEHAEPGSRTYVDVAAGLHLSEIISYFGDHASFRTTNRQ